MAAKQTKAAETKAIEPEMVSIAFTGFTATEEHGDKGIVEKYDEQGNAYDFMTLDEEFYMKKKEEKQISKHDFDILVAKGSIRNKEQQAEREALIKSNQPVYLMDDKERNMFLNDLPYEV